MKEQNGRIWMVVRLALLLAGALLIAGCAPRARVGALRSESQSVELGDGRPVRVEVTFGAGKLNLAGGAEKLLEADFTYNVARLKPEVKYRNGRLEVRQPEVRGLPVLLDIEDYRNEWDLRLNDEAPLDLRVEMGAGNSDLLLSGMSLTEVDISLGAGDSTIDLSGDWVSDLDVNIEAGASDISLRLPSKVGVRVEVETGLATIDASDLEKDGNVYTNAAYGESEVTLHVSLETGIGMIDLEVEKGTAALQD